MRVQGNYRTVCSVCKREVGATLNWEKMQAGALAGEYRVTRHAYDPRGSHSGRRPICPGGGILIHASEVVAAQ